MIAMRARIAVNVVLALISLVVVGQLVLVVRHSSHLRAHLERPRAKGVVERPSITMQPGQPESHTVPPAGGADGHGRPPAIHQNTEVARDEGEAAARAVSLKITDEGLALDSHERRAADVNSRIITTTTPAARTTRSEEKEQAQAKPGAVAVVTADGHPHDGTEPEANERKQAEDKLKGLTKLERIAKERAMS